MTSSSRPLEILVVSDHYAAHGRPIERMTETLIREIARRENMRFTWAATQTAAPLPDLPGACFLPIRGPALLQAISGKALPWWSARALNKVAAAIEASDLVWLHGALNASQQRVFRLAAARGKPVVVTYQGKADPGASGWIERRKIIPLLRAAAHVLFTSDRVGEAFFARAHFDRAITIVPNGVDLRIFHAPLIETRRYLRQQFALRAEQPVLLFAGSLIARRGLATLRALAKRLPSWRFWIAGQGPVDPERWMLPNVHVFRDRVGAGLAELYHAADLLLIPGQYDGFPTVAQEAMACGLPVMTSPEVAAGSRGATPLLHLAHSWPQDPARTAEAWAQSLQDFPLALPLQTPLYDLADYAQLTWDWGPIANVIAEIFRAQAA
jgi:glycosyltransferase involved in cell wall biosynthesis